ncbi:DUF4214 domain-containing protein [Pseudoduganella sp.]|uniref:DUF4214 domain-containing protein n=1 Tax=Pseudoduganella sp. TaxID=1880898 RepID=UPI0035AF3606
MLRYLVPLLLALGLSACGGGDTSTAEHKTQQMRQGSAVAVDYGPVVQQLYIAYFGRPADAGGLANFKQQLQIINKGETAQHLNAAYAGSSALQTVVNSFAVSAESQALYTGDTGAFVRSIYVNLLNREPDSEGKAYWVNAINSGQLTRAKAALSILTGALDNKTPQGLLDAQVINNKTANSAVFTQLVGVNVYSGDAAAALARDMLRKVKADTTLEGFRATIDSTVQAMTPTAPASNFAGNYAGNYDGSDLGTFTFTVASNGKITGNGSSTTSGVTLVITGDLGNASGTSVPLAGSMGPLNFSGTLTASGTLTGIWSGLGMSGSLRANRTSR